MEKSDDSDVVPSGRQIQNTELDEFPVLYLSTTRNDLM